MEGDSVFTGHLNLRIFPWDFTVKYPRGEKLMKSLNRGGVFFKGTCDRKGTCNNCRVDVYLEESAEQKELLACRAELHENAQVSVPPDKIMND